MNGIHDAMVKMLDADTPLEYTAAAGQLAAEAAIGAIVTTSVRTSLSALRLGLAVSGQIYKWEALSWAAGTVSGLTAGAAIDWVNSQNLGGRIYDWTHPIDLKVRTDYSSAQKWQPRRDPLTLDLNGDGLNTVGISLRKPILFDHDGDGVKANSGWVAATDGFLTLDRNGNQSIDNGTELFGDSTPLNPGGKATDGFAALGQEDTNQDGKVNNLDVNWNKLRVWRDLNQDGISASTELFTLDELGIASFETTKQVHSKVLADGNQLADLGTFTKVDGSSGTMGEVGQMADINLAEDTFTSQFTDHIPIAEGVAELPFMHGSGMVRELREAASLSTDLKELLTQYSQASTRPAQMALLDELLGAWADTSGMIAALQDRKDSDHLIEYKAFGNQQKFVANPFGGLMLNPDWQEIQSNWEQKLHILEAFNGRYFFPLLLERPTGQPAIFGMTVISNPTGIIEKIEIAFDQGQINLLNQSYDALRESVYTTLLVQTRFKSLINAIEMDVDANGIGFNFNQVRQDLAAQIAQDPVTGINDLLEFDHHIGHLLPESGWDANTLIDHVIQTTPLTPELEAVYATPGYGVKFGTDLNDAILADIGVKRVYGKGGDDTLTGWSGNNVLFGGDGNDRLIAGSGNNRLHGGTGDDVLQGGSGGDTFYFNRGDGNDTINGETWSGIPFNTLRFGAGIDASTATLARNGNDMIFRIGATDAVAFAGWFDRRQNYVKQVEFANGAKWDLATIRGMQVAAYSGSAGDDVIPGWDGIDRINGLGGNDWIAGFDRDDILDGGEGDDHIDGGDGNDQLNGGQGADRLDGGKGDDLIDGGAGDDTITDSNGANRIGGGLGNDTINAGGTIEGGKGDDLIYSADYRSGDIYVFNLGDGKDIIDDTSFVRDAEDTVRFGAGIAASAVTLARNGNDLVFKVSAADEVIVKHWFDRHQYIELVEFADGTRWDLAVLMGMQVAAYSGTTTDNVIKGWDGNDWINGLGGNDTIIGYVGDDILAGGDGDDAIEAGDGNDQIFGGLDADKLDGGAGDDLIDGGDGDDTIDAGDGDDRLLGGLGADQLDGGAGDDQIDGGAGNDTITDTTGANYVRGGEGNDTITTSGTVEGGKGDDVFHSSYVMSGDTYVFNLGDGNDTIADYGLTTALGYGAPDDTLRFGSGIAASAVTLARDGNDMLFRVSAADQVIIKDWFVDGFRYIEQVQFADGTRWDMATLMGMQIAAYDGSSADDAIKGWNGIDRINGLDGDDQIEGNAGDDTLAGGDGNDTIGGGAGDDQIDGGVGNDIIVDRSGVNRIQGGPGNDSITASGTIEGGKGDDVIQSANYDSGDVYVFNLGDGKDTIADYSGSRPAGDSSAPEDTLRFGAGIDASAVTRARDGNDMLFRVSATDQVTIKDWFVDGFHYIEQVQFADGTRWDMATLMGMQIAPYDGSSADDAIEGWNGIDRINGLDGDDQIGGNAGDDALAGGDGNDTIDGGAGNDQIDGGVGNDTITDRSGVNRIQGGPGNDTITAFGTIEGGKGDDVIRSDSYDSGDVYVFNLGDGKDTIADSGGFGSAGGGAADDTLRFGAGIAASAVTLVRTGDDMVCIVNDTDQVTIKDWFVSRFQYIEKIQFADGTEWNVSNPTDMMVGAYSGTAAADTIYGWDGIDRLNGLAGNDTLKGNAGDDILDGGDGDDLIVAGAGDDQLLGGLGADTMQGGPGDDIYLVDDQGDAILEHDGEGVDDVTSLVSLTLSDNLENLVLSGPGAMDGTGNWSANRIEGNSGANRLLGLAGDDDLRGEAGDDLLDGGRGIDSLRGGLGDDVYLVDGANDTVVENDGQGTDTVRATASYTLSANVENLVLESAGGAIGGAGNALANRLTGNASANRLDGAGGADILDGGLGNDTYVLVDKSDQILEAENGGRDTVEANFTYTLAPTLENLTLTGAGNIDATGNGANNALIGNAGNNRLDGGSGADTMAGGAGDDLYLADSIGDRIEESEGGGTDTIIRSVESAYVLSANVENLTLVGPALAGLGNALDNVITGNAGGNSLAGNGGNDILIGELGNDYLSGGKGNDVFVFNRGDGKDAVECSDILGATDTLRFGSGIGESDVLVVQSSANLVFKIKGTADQVSVLRYLNAATTADGQASDEKIDRIEFASGAAWDQADIQALVDRAKSNHAPGVKIFLPALKGSAGTAFSYAVAADTVTDPDPWDPIITYSIKLADGVALPAWLGFDPETRTLSGTPGAGDVGTFKFMLWGRDSYDRAIGQKVTMTIAASIPAPALATGLPMASETAGTDNNSDGSGTDNIADTPAGIEATASATDLIMPRATRATSQFAFSEAGYALLAEQLGRSDGSAGNDWYVDNQRPVAQFSLDETGILIESQTQKLISAMAAFAPPAAGQTILSPDYQASLNLVFTTNSK